MIKKLKKHWKEYIKSIALFWFVIFNLLILDNWSIIKFITIVGLFLLMTIYVYLIRKYERKNEDSKQQTSS